MRLARSLVLPLLLCALAGCGTDRAPAVSTPRQAPAAQEAPMEPDKDEQLAAALDAVTTTGEVRFAVAVLDPADGSTGVYGDEGPYDTASIVKVDILVALLLRAQDEGRELTGQERAHAHAMITSSDNAAATALWAVIGGAEGLDAAHARLGLDATRAGTEGRWGLTQTTAADQLVLPDAVFGQPEALTAASQAYVRGLLDAVVEGQDWGVSAAGDDDDGDEGDGSGTGSGGCALKNGWLPRSATGLWDINSIGRVTLDGRELLIAVLSDGHTTKEAGVALVERVARAAARAVV